MIDCCLENRVCNFKKNIFIKMIKRCINKKIKFRLKKYILSTYFKCLEFKKDSLFLFKSWIFFIYILKFLTILRFYDPFLRSEFVNGFPCRVKITILTTLIETTIRVELSLRSSGFTRNSVFGPLLWFKPWITM